MCGLRECLNHVAAFLAHCVISFCSFAVLSDAYMLIKYAHIRSLFYPYSPKLIPTKGFSLSNCIISHDCVLQPHCPGLLFLMSHTRASLIPVWLKPVQCFPAADRECGSKSMSSWLLDSCVVNIVVNTQGVTEGYLLIKNSCSGHLIFLSPDDLITWLHIQNSEYKLHIFLEWWCLVTGTWWNITYLYIFSWNIVNWRQHFGGKWAGKWIAF